MDELKVTDCLRCGSKCRQGTPDPKARAIRHAKEGFCPNCMITKFLLSIETIRDLIEGKEHHLPSGTARSNGLGPEILFSRDGKGIRKQIAVILTNTQMRADEINYIEVVGNWGLPWPKGREPKIGANF